MAAAKKKRLAYTGGLDAVVVLLPSGRAVEVARGQDIEVAGADAEALETNPEWTAINPPTEETD